MMPKIVPVLFALSQVAPGSPAFAPVTRTLIVDGLGVQVQLAGLDHPATQPVIVFESGAGTGLSAWSHVLPRVARFARVVAYDRSGIGGSEYDGEAPVPPRVADKLRRLLEKLGLPAPFILVGHSWGGPLIRTFAARFPGEVAGLVYVDPTDLRSRAEDLEYLRASGFSEQEALAHIEESHQRLLGFVRSRTGAYKGEMEIIHATAASFSAELRSLPPLPPVPAAVLLAGRFESSTWMGRPCEPAACHEQWLRFRTRLVGALLPAAAGNTVSIVAESGHEIHRDAPNVVVAAIRRVFSDASPQR